MSENIKAIQRILGTKADGIWGSKSQAALAAEINQRDEAGVHHVKASSFADEADVKAFKRCKAQGNSDQFCFSKGDNGIGCWGDDTTGNTPMCALPRDIWQARFEPDKKARGAKVKVTIGGKTVICELRDTMPHSKNIKNGAGIDLNPGAQKAFGLKAPFMVDATWQWA